MSWRKTIGALALCGVLVILGGGAPALALCALAGVGVPAVIAYPDAYSAYVMPSLRAMPCSVMLTRDGYPAVSSGAGPLMYVVGAQAIMVPTVAVGMVPVALLVPVTATTCSFGGACYVCPGGAAYTGVVVVP